MEINYNNMPWDQLETGCPMDVTNELINYYGANYGVKVAVGVLTALNQGDLADQLTMAQRAGNK